MMMMMMTIAKTMAEPELLPASQCSLMQEENEHTKDHLDYNYFLPPLRKFDAHYYCYSEVEAKHLMMDLSKKTAVSKI